MRSGYKSAKYRNKKVVYRGETFDSRHELNRWLDLLLLQRSGAISDLRRQVPYELIPAQREPDTVGKRGGIKRGRIIEQSVTYIADFVYTECGKTVVEDAKGVRTKEYIIKRKLMLWLHGIRVREV